MSKRFWYFLAAVACLGASSITHSSLFHAHHPPTTASASAIPFASFRCHVSFRQPFTHAHVSQHGPAVACTHRGQCRSPPSSPPSIKLTHQCRLGLSHAYVYPYYRSLVAFTVADTLRTAHPQPLVQPRRPHCIPQDQSPAAQRSAKRTGEYVTWRYDEHTRAAADSV